MYAVVGREIHSLSQNKQLCRALYRSYLTNLEQYKQAIRLVMAGLALLTIAALLLVLVTQSYCAVVARVDNLSPTPNTTIAELVGPASLQFNCDIYEDRSGTDTRVTTAWFLRFPSNPENLFVIQTAATHPEFNISGTAREGGPFPTFRNSLILINMTSALDEVWLICGHSAQGGNDLARWRLRAYYPPQLSNGRVIKVDERDGNIPMDIATPPLAYPTPTDFQWTKDGVTIPTSPRATFSYPSVLFNSLERSDSGLYSLIATNHRTDNGLAIGTGQGSFTLDVLYGPDIVPSTQIYSAVVGDSITLVCGTSLESNPMATIAWLDQLGLPIPNAGRYTFNKGTEVVSLDFSFTRAGDSGVWACVLGVSDPDVMVASGGQLVSRDNKEIGSRTNQITLVIVVPPSEPQVVEVQSQATNATLSWIKPSDAGQPRITAYQITADDGMVTPIVYTSSDNLTEQTITGLLPGREYQFTVRAVSASGDAVALSNASLPVFANTSTTAPSPPTISGPREAFAGETTQLNCSSSVSNVLTLSWVRVGRLSLPSSATQVGNNLVFTNPQSTDTGTYSCTLTSTNVGSNITISFLTPPTEGPSGGDVNEVVIAVSVVGVIGVIVIILLFVLILLNCQRRKTSYSNNESASRNPAYGMSVRQAPNDAVNVQSNDEHTYEDLDQELYQYIDPDNNNNSGSGEGEAVVVSSNAACGVTL